LRPEVSENKCGVGAVRAFPAPFARMRLRVLRSGFIMQLQAMRIGAMEAGTSVCAARICSALQYGGKRAAMPSFSGRRVHAQGVGARAFEMGNCEPGGSVASGAPNGLADHIVPDPLEPNERRELIPASQTPVDRRKHGQGSYSRY